jgi:glutamate/tyrosine decarboxylase-like PLP-dependent enzyme
MERADSVTCDAHKWFNMTMGAGMFFCRDASILDETFRVQTAYMPSVGHGSVDPFVASVQWSRRFIGLKLFMALAARGAAGYAAMIEHQADLGEHMRLRLAEAGWTHVSRTSLPVCCVTHPRIQAGELAMDDVLAGVLARGRVWISKVTLAGRSALRACVTSRLATREDIDVLVDELEAQLP